MEYAIVSPPLQSPQKITVICLGNICRSPVAEYLLRHYAAKSEHHTIKSLIIDSAGLNGGYYDMDPNSQAYLRQKGIDPTSFQSKRTSRKYLEKFDLILVMEAYMKREILQDYFFNLSPADIALFSDRIQLFSEIGGDRGDIEDPYGSPTPFYLKVLNRIDEIAGKIIEKLEKS